jgi:hypothetical protein
VIRSDSTASSKAFHSHTFLRGPPHPFASFSILTRHLLASLTENPLPLLSPSSSSPSHPTLTSNGSAVSLALSSFSSLTRRPQLLLEQHTSPLPRVQLSSIDSLVASSHSPSPSLIPILTLTNLILFTQLISDPPFSSSPSSSSSSSSIHSFFVLLFTSGSPSITHSTFSLSLSLSFALYLPIVDTPTSRTRAWFTIHRPLASSAHRLLLRSRPG